MKLRYIIIGVIGFLLTFGILFTIVSNYSRKALGIKDTGHLYLITVDDLNNSTTHMADSIITETDRCIEFRNEFGLIEKECGDRISKIAIK